MYDVVSIICFGLCEIVVVTAAVASNVACGLSVAKLTQLHNGISRHHN